MLRRLELTLKASLAEIERLHQTWQVLHDEHLIPNTARWPMQLAVEELVTNIITYGYKDHPEATIGVEILVGPASVHVTLTDAAPQFDPLQIPAPPANWALQEREPGGFGIHLVRGLMDQVEYQHLDGKNRVSLEKRF